MSEAGIRRYLLAGSLLVALLACEGIARIVQRPRPEPASPFTLDPLLQYRPRPGLTHDFPVPGRSPVRWVTNSRGFRGPEFDAGREAGTSRIVILGDSVAFGYFNPEAATIASFLREDLLRRAPAEVINAGVPGYVSLQSLLLLQTEVLDWRPDLVFLVVGWNDAALGYRKDWSPARTLQMAPVGRRYPEDPTLLHHVDAILRKASALYRLARSRRLHSEAARDAGGGMEVINDEGLFLPPAAPVNTRALGTYRRNIESIAAVCRAREIRLIVATWPSSLGGEISSDAKKRMLPWLRPLGVTLPTVVATWQSYTAEIRSLAAERGVEILDLERIFEATGSRMDLFADPIHLLDEGNRVVAAELARRIVAAGTAGKGEEPNKAPARSSSGTLAAQASPRSGD